MKFDSIEQLFGTEEFTRPLGSGDQLGHKKKPKKKKPVLPDRKPADAPQPVTEAGEEPTMGRTMEDLSGAATVALATVRSEAGSYLRQLFPRPLVIFGLFSILLTIVGLCVVTLHVKMRKNALSYELSAQTRMMRRLEKRKAMFELEYSFLRSSRSVTSKVQETGWHEIVPHSIKFIKPAPTKEGPR